MHKVSIIIPTYNCAQYITEAIDSVLKQTYKDWEVVVVDDGSIDDTKSVLQYYIESGKIRYIYQGNMGPGAARNRGIQASSGKYIAFLDSDDKWAPRRLESTLYFIEQHNYDWVCSAFYRELRGSGHQEVKRLDHRSLTDNGLTICLLKEGIFFFSSVYVHTNTILARKECFDRVGLFNENYRIGEDWDMWLRFEESGLEGGYLDEPLAYYIIRNEGITKSSHAESVDFHLQLAIKHARILGLHRSKIRSSLGGVYFKYADISFYEHINYQKALGYVLKGFFYRPDIKKIMKGFRILVRRMLKLTNSEVKTT